MKYLLFCRIALVIALAFFGSCSVQAQDFSTVPDFPSDFTLLDPNASSGGSTSSVGTASPTATPRPSAATSTSTTKVQNVPTGPDSLAVVTLATLAGLGALGLRRMYILTSHDDER